MCSADKNNISVSDLGRSVRSYSLQIPALLRSVKFFLGGRGTKLVRQVSCGSHQLSHHCKIATSYNITQTYTLLLHSLDYKDLELFLSSVRGLRLGTQCICSPLNIPTFS